MHSSNTSTCNYYHPITSISKSEDDPSSPSLFNFPNSPHMHLEYEDVYLQFLDLFYQQQSTTSTADTVLPDQYHQPTITNTADSEDNAAKNDAAGGCAKADHQHQLLGRKRSSKKDRHSKINTARGPRDRRMRLSLEVARKFFDLQDLLGYDKASRTVDWLLRNSRAAIRELANQLSCSLVANSGSSISDDCEVVSSSNHSTTVKRADEPSCSNKQKRATSKKVKAARATVGRESRTRARERARERTSQKRRLLSESTGGENLFGKLSVNSHGLKEAVGGWMKGMEAVGEDLSSDEGRRPDCGVIRDDVVGNALGCSTSCPWKWNTSISISDCQDNIAGLSHQVSFTLARAHTHICVCIYVCRKIVV